MSTVHDSIARYEALPAKAVQIAWRPPTAATGGETQLVALCADGSIWKYDEGAERWNLLSQCFPE
jgi:hypothetical protein